MKFSCARIFSDHMVLQRNRPIAVFGKGPEGAKVQVELAGRSAETVCRDGKWRAILPAMEEKGSQTLTVRCGGEEISFGDVLLGEVWLAGGQSNMELALEDARSGGEEIPRSADPLLRYYHTVKTASEADRARAESEVPAGWVCSAPETAGRFSAVGYHFAQRLRRELDVPVGIVGCNWGGTSASCWMSRETLSADPELAVYFADYDQAVKGRTEEEYQRQKADYQAQIDQYNVRMAAVPVSKSDMDAFRAASADIIYPWPPPMGADCFLRPCGLYETMLSHVAPYTLRGVIWYQGESDDQHAPLYSRLLTTMIAQWRADFMQDDLFFDIVQLPGYAGETPEADNWGVLRLNQEKVKETVPHTALAVIYDVGERDNIHPIDKKTVGGRLADQALAAVYGGTADVRLGKLVQAQAGEKALHLTFDVPLCVCGERVEGFQIFGKDGAWRDAQATVQGETVTLTGEAIAGARYAMTNWTQANVFQKNGIPLPPFVWKA